MTIIAQHADAFKTTDFTAAINEVENQYGFINSQGLFDTYTTSEKAIVFDKTAHNITLLPAVNRGDRSFTTGKERDVEQFSLPLAYFKHEDNLTAEDILGFRAPGMQDKETVERASAEKVQDIRFAVDQTREYLKLQAMKGIFKTPNGTTLANMFTEFGVTQQTEDFTLDVGTTDINGVIMSLKRKVKAGLKTSTMNGVDVYCDEEFFDKLISHANMKAIYLLSNQASAAYKDETASYEQWGVMDSFTHKGVRFIQYTPTFNLPTCATEDFLGANTAIFLFLICYDYFCFLVIYLPRFRAASLAFSGVPVAPTSTNIAVLLSFSKLAAKPERTVSNAAESSGSRAAHIASNEGFAPPTMSASAALRCSTSLSRAACASTSCSA